MIDEIDNCSKSLQNTNQLIPIPPSIFGSISTNSYCDMTFINSKSRRQNNKTSSSPKDLWERLFYQGYKADVCINTNNGGVVYGHSNILVSSSILFH